jgi:peptide/nickel transport system substrate-binding protein
MRNRLFSVIAAGVIVVAACSPSAQTTPSPSSGAPSEAASAPAESAAASGAASGGASGSATAAGGVDITTTKYKAEPTGNKGGNLVVGISGDPTTIWTGIYDTFANDQEAFGPALWALWSNTGDLKYYGQLATDVPTKANGGVTVNGSNMDVKVNMVPGAMWSDGQPINCDDVIYMESWIMNKDQSGLAYGTAGYDQITSIDGAGTTNCVLHFKGIYEPYLSLFTPLLPAHYLKTSSVKDAQKNLYVDTHPQDGVYSGPYMPTAWAHNAQINYVPNTQFWKTIKKADAPFDTVTMKFYADTNAEIAGFANSEIDVGLEFNQNDVAAMASLDQASVDKILGPTYEQHSWNYKSLTTKFGAAGAKAMMEALHYAYDKDAINQTITGGTVTPTCNGIYPDSWFFDSKYGSDSCYKHDADKAASILQAAGFTKGSDGLLTLNGNKADFLGCTRADRQYRLDTLTLLGSQLAPLGIKITPKGVPSKNVFGGWTTFPADTPCNTTHGNFDVVEFAWVGSPDPGGNYFLYHSKFDPDTGDHSGQNYIRVHNPDVDKEMDTVATSVDLNAIKVAMSDFQKTYTDPAQAFPEIALYNWTTVMLKAPKMHNISNNGSSAVQTWNMEDWWRDQ